MPWDFKIDPITRDFVRDGRGGWEHTETADTAVLHQLEIHYGTWWGDDAIGSRLHDRALFASDPGPGVAAETTRALGLLVDEQLIGDVQVTAKEVKAGRVDGRTSYRLVETGQLVQLALPLVRPTRDGG